MQSDFLEATSIINFIIEEGKEESFDHHQFIYQAEDNADTIYLVKSGHVLINRMLEDGKEFSLKMLGARSIFGSTTLFCGAKKHSLFARTKSKTVLYKMPLEQFENAILNDEVLKYEWLLWVQNENAKQEYRFRDLVTIGKKGALYSTLIRLSNTYGVMTKEGMLLNVDLTNNELANFCSTTRESVNRMISELKSKNIIKMDGKRITIMDMQFLKDEINCENCPINICRIE